MVPRSTTGDRQWSWTVPVDALSAARGRARRPAPDAACVAAVDLARGAARAVAGDPGDVGDHLGYEIDGDRVLTHSFACNAAGYPGWRWSVTVARASRARTVTVDEVVLLPGAASLLAPGWVPWSERVRPEDLGPGDLLPAGPGDPRLEPGYSRGTGPAGTRTDAAEPARIADELGLGRARVLSVFGRDDAAGRWTASVGGPETDLARAAPARCATCGFLVPLGGDLRVAFGVCANAMSPLDARVVALDSGCGAHSEGTEPGDAGYRFAATVLPPVIDELDLADFTLGDLLADGPLADLATG